MDHVGEFVDDDVVYALFRGLDEVNVKGDDAAASAVAPLAFHASQLHLFGFEVHDDREVVQTLLQVALRLFFVEAVIVRVYLLFSAVFALVFKVSELRVVLQGVGLAKVEDLFAFYKPRLLCDLLKSLIDPRLFFIDELEDSSFTDL